LEFDLRAPLAQDRLKVFYGIVVRVECIRLLFREFARLTHCRGHEARLPMAAGRAAQPRVDDHIDGDGNRRREEESERKSCRRSMTVYSHGSLPMSKFHRILFGAKSFKFAAGARPQRKAIIKSDFVSFALHGEMPNECL